MSRRLRWALAVLILYLSSLASAQGPSAASGTAQAPAAKERAPQEQQSDSPDVASTEKKVTPQQAEQLFRDVDTILQFASKDTALPVKHEVKRQLASREVV